MYIAGRRRAAAVVGRPTNNNLVSMNPSIHAWLQGESARTASAARSRLRTRRLEGAYKRL